MFALVKVAHVVPEFLNCASAGRGRRDERGEVARDEAGARRGAEADACAPRAGARRSSGGAVTMNANTVTLLVSQSSGSLKDSASWNVCSPTVMTYSSHRHMD